MRSPIWRAALTLSRELPVLRTCQNLWVPCKRRKEGGTEEEEKRKREEKLGERDRKREEKVLAVKTWPLIAILQRLNKGQRN